MKGLLTLCVLSSCLVSSVTFAQEAKLMFNLEHADKVWSARFSPDGRYVVTTSDETPKIWEVETGKLLVDLNGHTSIVPRASFSPDGRYVVTASYDRTAKIWEARTGKLLVNLKGHTDAVWGAEFSPDGKYVATASLDKTAKIRETATGRVVGNLKGHTDAVWTATFSPDGRYVVTASSDKTAKIWETSTGKLLVNLTGSTAGIDAAGFSPDRTRIVTVSFNQPAMSWEANTGKCLGAVPMAETRYAIPWMLTSDGKYLAVGAGQKSAKIIETSTAKTEWNLTQHRDKIQGIAFSPDGRYVVTASSDKTAKIWEIPGATTISIPKPTAPANLKIESITFSDQMGNKNDILDANEKATITFSLSNTGKGDAYNMVAEVKSLNSAKYLEYSIQSPVGNLAPGSRTIVDIPISATQNVESGKSEFEIQVKEANGFDADPIRISFSTQKFRNPLLAIADFKFTTDHGGKIKPGQSVSLEIILQNRGQGQGSNIKIVFNNPQNVFPGSETVFTFDKIESNETKIITYEFFANKMYAAKEIPIEVVVTESYNKYGEKRTLNVSLEQNLSQTQTVTVSGREDKPIQIDNVSLQSDTGNSVQTTTVADNVNTISGVPVFYSLFIGVDKYQFSSGDLPNLNKPVNDAASLRNLLLTNYFFPQENSSFLKNPTRADILNVLEDLAKKITSKDNLLIFYAGHGYWDERLKVGYWLPSDSKTNDKSSWISNSTVRDYIAGIQSKHTLLIADACFSGGIFKTREITSEISEYGVAKIYRLPSRKAMTSGTLTTVPDESKFMQFLLKRLTENSSKYLTARQLFYSLETAVINNTNAVPQLGVIQETGDEGGDFIFIRK
jgi:WD40 repeat protein